MTEIKVSNPVLDGLKAGLEDSLADRFQVVLMLLELSVTLDSDRGKRRLFKTVSCKGSSKGVFRGTRDKGSLKGFFKGHWRWGLPQQVLAMIGCVRRYKGFYKGAYTQE